MVECLGRVLNRPIRYVDIPETVAAEHMLNAGLPQYVVEGLTQTFVALRNNEFAYTTDAVERTAGRPPGTFENWCRKHIQLFL